jgi:hypothetical protein
MRNKCSRCQGDDPACYVCRDKAGQDDLAQVEYAFEMHQKCCDHLKIDSANDAEGGTLLEAICKLEINSATALAQYGRSLDDLMTEKERMAKILLRIGWPSRGGKDDLASIGDFASEIQNEWTYDELSLTENEKP